MNVKELNSLIFSKVFVEYGLFEKIEFESDADGNIIRYVVNDVITLEATYDTRDMTDDLGHVIKIHYPTSFTLKQNFDTGSGYLHSVYKLISEIHINDPSKFVVNYKLETPTTMEYKWNETSNIYRQLRDTELPSIIDYEIKEVENRLALVVTLDTKFNSIESRRWIKSGTVGDLEYDPEEIKTFSSGVKVNSNRRLYHLESAMPHMLNLIIPARDGGKGTVKFQRMYDRIERNQKATYMFRKAHLDDAANHKYWLCVDVYNTIHDFNIDHPLNESYAVFTTTNVNGEELISDICTYPTPVEDPEQVQLHYTMTISGNTVVMQKIIPEVEDEE